MTVTKPQFLRSAPTRGKQPLLWLACLPPAGYLALFYSFVLRARLALGVWPEPYQPDPKSLGFGIHHAMVLLGAPLWMASPVVVLMLVALRPGLRGRKMVLPLVVFAMLYTATWLILQIDPGNFAYWIAD